MPLVRIDLPRSVSPDLWTRIGDVVYQTLVDVLNVPKDDLFQVITAHDSESLRISPNYLGIARSAQALIIDITLNSGRSTELKQQFYAALVDRLNAAAQVRPEDVSIVLTEVPKENWSFGNGQAQYV